MSQVPGGGRTWPLMGSQNQAARTFHSSLPIIIKAPYTLQMTGVGSVKTWQPIVLDAPYSLEMTGLDNN